MPVRERNLSPEGDAHTGIPAFGTSRSYYHLRDMQKRRPDYVILSGNGETNAVVFRPCCKTWKDSRWGFRSLGPTESDEY